ncbi:unnamed protein product [Closterium sp. Naga37s-1]|nr:unnamed protein product [Closterium sp. Naga37s-1]
MSKVLIAEGLGYNLLSVSQLMAKGIHLEADSTTQEFKLYHGKGGLYIGKAILKNNVFVLGFVPDLGTADSDGIVTFTSWTHPPDLDPDFSPEGFWYSHTIPEAERTRALATIQTTSTAAETTSAAAETTPAAAETTSAVAELSTVAAGTSTPIAGPSTAPLLVNDTPPTPAQQLHPAPREVHPYAPLEKVYSDILYNREPGQNAYNYTITFIDAATRYVWHLNLPSKDMAFEAFVAWLPVAERESGVKLKSFQSDGGGEYTSQRFKQYLAERGIKRLISLPYAHQQQGVAERMSRTLQNTMRKLLRGMRLPTHQWPEAMDHAVMLHNLLSSSSLPNNTSPHLLWTGKLGSTKMLRVFGCMVQYRPPSARAGRFSQRAQWGLHLGIEKHYNAWKIFDVETKETVAARDVIFYERLTLQTYLANLDENRDPTGGFRGDRAFASAEDEADWDEQNVEGASEEAGPLPYCSVNVPMDDENPRESINDETYYHFADNGYVTPAQVNTNEAERIGPNFAPDPEAGDEAAYPADMSLPRYTPSGLQILGLVTAVHGTDIPKEPATVQQALGGEHREKWREAMDKELKALEERNTWKIVPIGVARNKTILTGKWVFRVKTKADGTIDKFKARWVVRGFDQEHGRDFTETFAPVSRHTSLRILLAIAAMKKKKLRQIDVANAFLYAPVDAEIFVELPHGTNGEPNQVCQLLKSLYGIKQAPRLWQQYLHARLIRIGFKQLPHDQGMHRLTKGADYILLIVYVDDLLYIGSTDSVTTWFEGELQQDLTLTVSSTVTQYLGLNIREEEDAIYLSAAKYADTIAKRFALTPTIISTPYRYTSGNNKEGSALLKPAGIRDYQRKLGCLLFAAVTCRPDLSYSASQLATYLKRPETEHLAELDRALHYLISTPTIGLTYYKNATTPPKLIGYVDADHAGDSDNRRSRTGYIYRLEPIGPISWQSSKQELIALSSAEAEYIALCSATKEGLYLRELLEEAKLAQLPSFTLFCDNQSAIRIANKNGFANRTKHIALRYFFVKDEIEKGRLELSYCPTSEMAADYLTKKLGKQKFEYCMLLTGQSHVSDTPEAKGSVGNNRS